MFNLTVAKEREGDFTGDLAVLSWDETALFAMSDFKMAGDVLAFADEESTGAGKLDAAQKVAAKAVHARWQHPVQEVYRVTDGALIQVFDGDELAEIRRPADVTARIELLADV